MKKLVAILVIFIGFPLLIGIADSLLGYHVMATVPPVGRAVHNALSVLHGAVLAFALVFFWRRPYRENTPSVDVLSKMLS